jgi:hypothetical protein
MGQNDHLPNKQTRSASRKRGRTAELLDWSMADPATLANLVGKASQAGAYIAFGATLPATCLLLYVRSGDWKERIAIEDRDDINGTLSDLIDDFE